MDKLKYIKLENEDGTYGDSVPISVDSNYVDIGNNLNLNNYINTNNTNVNNLQNTTVSLDSRITTNTNAIQGLASGSPKGSYTNAAAIVSANPDTGVYIAQDDGHVYSWVKNGSSVIDLGVYQAVSLENDSVKMKQIDNSNFGLMFKATPTSINNSIICRLILATGKRFNSKSSTIRIQGTYHCNDKNITWFYVAFGVSGSNYGQQKTIIAVDNANNYKKDVSFDTTINGFSISATVTALRFVVDGGGAATLDHYIKDLKIWVNDELYVYGVDYTFDNTTYDYCLEEKIAKDFIVGKARVDEIENDIINHETRITSLENEPIPDKSITSSALADSIKGKKYIYDVAQAEATYPLWFRFKIKDPAKCLQAKDIQEIKLNYTINKLNTNFSNAFLAASINGANFGVVTHSGYNGQQVVIADAKWKANTDYYFENLVNHYNRTETVIIKEIRVGIDTNNAKDFNFYIKDLEIWINGELYSDADLELVEQSYISVEDVDKNWPLASRHFVNEKIKPLDTKVTSLEETVSEIPVEELLQIKNYDALSKSDLYNIVCWGDSLTAGVYPTWLQNWINNENVHVTNKGVSGEASGTIAFRQGGNIILATEDFTIPANTDPVLFTFSVSAGDVPNLARIHTKAKINDVEGTITIETRESDSQKCIQFVRDEAGESVSVNSGTRVEPLDAENYRDNLAIIWVGRNDMAFSWPTQITGTLDNIKKMIEYLTPTIKRFLVLPILNSTGETSESTADARRWILTIESQLKELYPNNFVDIRRYIIDQCIYDMGVTPTTEDLNNMALDAPPPSIMADSVHPSSEARKYIAREIYRVMKTKDWVR